MPKRNGYEVATFVKGHPDFKHIPVLLLAGAFEPVDETKARQAGCDGVLVKPFEPQQVVMRVRELLGGIPGSGPPGMSGSRPAPAPDAASGSGDYFDQLDTAIAKRGRPTTSIASDDDDAR